MALLFKWLFMVVASRWCAQAQYQSPCPNVLRYETKGDENDRWYGELMLSTSDDLEGVWIRLMLDRAADLIGNWFGETTSNDNKDFTIKNVKYRLEAGPPISVRFFVKYNPNGAVPRVRTIRLNGRTICDVNMGGNEMTTPRLHISKPAPTRGFVREETPRPIPTRVDSGSGGGGSGSGGNGQSTLDYFPGDYAIRRPSRPTTTSRPTAQSHHSSSTPNCGRIATRATPLISHGQNTTAGQWPWHVALYHSQGIQLMYTCGGTLIDNQHVITAAHCVARPQTNRPIASSNLLVYLGKHNLKKFGSEVQDREVSDIFIHPKYNYTVYFDDIAILRLDRSIDYTNYVRPCCLWEGPNDLEHVIGRHGTVVGWGFDEEHQLSNLLMQAQMPIVSTVTCIYSNRDFFSQFTSERTFCAGFRNGTTVCNGDSGGGMVLQRDGSTDSGWQLRGVVSVGVALQGRGVCDPDQYVVFTDVAKHLDWIRSVLNR